MQQRAHVLKISTLQLSKEEKRSNSENSLNAMDETTYGKLEMKRSGREIGEKIHAAAFRCPTTNRTSKQTDCQLSRCTPGCASTLVGAPMIIRKSFELWTGHASLQS